MNSPTVDVSPAGTLDGEEAESLRAVRTQNVVLGLGHEQGECLNPATLEPEVVNGFLEKT